jgi:hypothetical protein
MVFNREVSAECGKTDKYKRQVCKIIVDGCGGHGFSDSRIS